MHFYSAIYRSNDESFQGAKAKAKCNRVKSFVSLHSVGGVSFGAAGPVQTHKVINRFGHECVKSRVRQSTNRNTQNLI